MIRNFIQFDLEVVSFIIIIILSFVGSLAKDYISLFKYDAKINYIRILLSTITASIVTFFLESYITETFGFRGLVIASFMVGLIGFELLEHMSSLNGIIGLFIAIFFNRSKDVRDYTDLLKKEKDDSDIKKIIIVKEDKDDTKKK